MDQQPPAFHPLDYISVVRRRIWWLVVPIGLAILVGLALATYLPRQYQSTATLGISLPEIGGQVLSDAQRLSAAERTRSINQVLLSPMVLERVAKDDVLDRQVPLEDAVRQIANSVDVRLPPDGGSSQAVEIFYVDYAAASPQVAQRVANRLAEVFVEESSRKRGNRAATTSDFLATTVAESAKRLQEIEGRLTQAKEVFMGSLPEQMQSNLAGVEQLSRQIDSFTVQMQGERDTLRMVEEKLEAYRPPVTADGEPASPAARPVDTQVLELERQLQQALIKYTPKHAEVRRLERELELARSRAADAPAATGPRRAASASVDPTYERLLDAELRSQQRIADLQRTIDSLRQQTAEYRARVDAAPRVQQEIAGIQREYELEKANYEDLTSKLRTAELDESVERMQGGEQFTIIARASLPSSPSSPNVPRLMAMTVLLGVCLGGALALGREYLDRSIYDARNLSDLDVPVLGEIPRISQV